MVVTVSGPDQPDAKLEIEPVKPWPGHDLFLVTTDSPLGPEKVRRAASAMGEEPYEVVKVKQPGIYALVVKSSLLESYSAEELLSLVRPLVATGTVSAPLVGVRILKKERANAATAALPPSVEPTIAPLTVAAAMEPNVVCADPEESVRSAAERMAAHQVGCLPVVEGERVVGMVTSRDLRQIHPAWQVRDVMTTELVTVSPDAPLPEAQRLMEEAGIERLVVMQEGRLAGILTKADLLKRLGYQTDSLTGLCTSSYLRQFGERLLKQGREVAVIFIDLNGFGELNKIYGHVFGDHVLQEVAKVLLQLTDPATDLPCRYGGDEFAVLTTRNSIEAYNLAQRLLAAVRELRFQGEVTVSACAGIAGGRRLVSRPGTHPAATLDSLINLASLASTRAKKQRTAIVFGSELRAVSN